MAAKEAFGIRFRIPGINATQTSNRIPWYTVDILVFFFFFTLAEERTITEVMGRPPINPEIILPMPCAFSSRSLLVTLWYGSRSSTASILNSVSRLATNARVMPVIQTSLFKKLLKSGRVKNERNPEADSATGIETMCFGSIAYSCLLYTSDAADERSSVDLGGRRII